MTTAWHVEPEILARYSAGEVDDARAFSLESHLLACERCRAALAATGGEDRERLDRSWTRITEMLDAPRPGVVERGLVWFGVREHVARLLAATPSLRVSWFAAEAIALGFAVIAANASASRGRGTEAVLLVFLVMAALIPVAGVAVAYGRGIDPTYEVGLASPMRSFGLLLIRAAAVLGTSTVLAGAAALALPGPDWTAAAWLLPSLGLTLACLALATRVRPLVAAGSVAFTWILVAASVSYGRADRLIVFRGQGQFAFVFVIAVSAWVLARRRDAFDQGVME
jgi:hypothetical protein